MNIDINKFNQIYPEFEKNVNTWVLYKYYRQIPLNKLKKLETFLNEVEGKKIYNCTSCNVGNMLKKLYEIKQYIDNEIKDNEIKEIEIKEQDENDKELIQTTVFEGGNNDIKTNNKNTQQQNIKKNNKKTKK